MLEGDNAYFCDKCERKRNALKRYSIKRLPNVLFLMLRRFEFNYDTMTKFKVNDYCSFPIDLDMSPYCQEVITRNELLKEMDEKSLSVEDLNEEQQIILNREITKSYYQFKLKGIVVHQGTADAGHYYCYIQNREQSSEDKPEDSWFCFNDKEVEKFDPNNIPD
jgi:ubiquitin C-terminal hydrolase